MRELFKALSEIETRLMEQYGVSLNEAREMCIRDSFYAVHAPVATDFHPGRNCK